MYSKALSCALHYLILRRVILQGWKGRYYYLCFTHKEAESTQGFKDLPQVSNLLVKESTRIEGRGVFPYPLSTVHAPQCHLLNKVLYYWGEGGRQSPPPTKYFVLSRIDSINSLRLKPKTGNGLRFYRAGRQ